MDQLHVDIVTIGAGLASTSMALALLDQGYSGDILMLEKQSHVNTNKTWCFWGTNAVPEHLKPLIRKRWSCWQVSTETDLCEQTSRSEDSDSPQRHEFPF